MYQFKCDRLASPENLAPAGFRFHAKKGAEEHNLPIQSEFLALSIW